jgi:hypothetical protein
VKNREYHHDYRPDGGYYDLHDIGSYFSGDPSILLLCLVVVIIFILGVSAGKSGEHTRQRRLKKVLGRINSLDPADVTDYRLSTIEDVLPKERK